MPLEEPRAVIAFVKGDDRLASLLEGLEVVETRLPYIEHLNKAFDDKTVSGSTTIDVSRFILFYIRI